MDFFTTQHFIWALSLGALSAVSLPLGSFLGIRYNLRPLYISILAAFGAGALLAALSIELVAPSVLALTVAVEGTVDHVRQNFYGLLAGLISGGLIYILLDQLVNAHGGFLRKTVSVVKYLSIPEKKKKNLLIEKLSQFSILQELSSEHINTLLTLIKPIVFNDKDVIGSQGDQYNQLIFITSGKVDIKHNGKFKINVGNGTVFGLVQILADIPNATSAYANGTVKGLVLSKENFEVLMELSREFNSKCREKTSNQLDKLEQYHSSHIKEVTDWKSKAMHALELGTKLPNTNQLKRIKEEHEGAPLAIWLGILIDGIPESFVIGSGMLIMMQAKADMIDSLSFIDIFPFTLIAGLFLANFPEALSSSANMKKQGWSKKRIFLMWFSLMIVTAIGSGFGYLLADSLNHTWLIFAEGLAAGAMLTMIASAMIPEAVIVGNASVVGISTLAGFVSAISFKLLE